MRCALFQIFTFLGYYRVWDGGFFRSLGKNRPNHGLKNWEQYENRGPAARREAAAARRHEDSSEDEDASELEDEIRVAAAREKEREKRRQSVARALRSPTGSEAAASSDDEEAPRKADPEKSGYRKVYLDLKSSQQVLIAMSLGLVDPVSKRKLGDFVNDSVYLDMTNKAAFLEKQQ